MSDSFVVYRSFRDAIRALEPEEQAAVYNALCDYALDGIEPSLTGVPAAMFMLMRPQIDANTKRRENGCRGGRPRTKEKPNDNQTITKEEPSHNQEKTESEPNVNVNVNVNDNVNVNVRFKAPTVEEVRAYTQEYSKHTGLKAIDAERFCDFYVSKNWMVGKTKMKDWKAAVRNWMRTDKKQKASVINFSQRDDSYSMMLKEGNW